VQGRNNFIRYLVEELKGRDHMVDLGVDGRMHGNVTQSRCVIKI